MKKDGLAKVVEVFSVFLFTILVLCVATQVITRYVMPSLAPAWTEEMARVLYIWVVFFGMVLVEAEEKGIRTTYFLSKMAAPVRVALLTIMASLQIIFCVMLCYGSWIMLFESWGMQMGSVRWMTGAVIYMPACSAPILMIFYLIKQIIKAFKTNGAVPEEGAEN